MARYDDCDFRISTHAPHAGHDLKKYGIADLAKISTHAPHAGHDIRTESTEKSTVEFQLTRPMRGTTPVYGERK